MKDTISMQLTRIVTAKFIPHMTNSVIISHTEYTINYKSLQISAAYLTQQKMI